MGFTVSPPVYMGCMRARFSPDVFTVTMLNIATMSVAALAVEKGWED